MTTFVLTITMLLGIDSMFKLWCLADNRPYAPTQKELAVDLLLQIALIIWGAVLIGGA